MSSKYLPVLVTESVHGSRHITPPEPLQHLPVLPGMYKCPRRHTHSPWPKSKSSLTNARKETPRTNWELAFHLLHFFIGCVHFHFFTQIQNKSATNWMSVMERQRTEKNFRFRIFVFVMSVLFFLSLSLLLMMAEIFKMQWQASRQYWGLVD